MPVIKAASACVWRGDEVLLVQRGNAFGHGFWSLPGGRIESGESALEAAARELMEETGCVAILTHMVGEFILESGKADYAISCFAGLHSGGEAVARSDARAVAWVHFRQLASLRLAPHTAEAIGRARELLRH